MGVSMAGGPSSPPRLEHPAQLAVIVFLALMVFGALGMLYVQSLSLPKCGAHHVASPTAVPKPEEIRCRK
ncbi:MAG: hypothetical protein ACYDGR_14875 [Candidatus Dormibacteria bacterium]